MSKTSSNPSTDSGPVPDTSGQPMERSPAGASPTYMICVVSVMPLRATPSDSSEMVSQLLFGEAVVVLETGPPGWVRIRNQFDQYEGWAATNQLTVISEALYEEPTESYTTELITTVLVNGHAMQLSRGSFLKKIKHGLMTWNNVKTHYDGLPITPATGAPVDKKKIEFGALQFLNTPYLWGGRSAFGIDCSGLVQSVFRLLGKALPRDASQQAHCGVRVEDETPPEVGDLAFFHAPGKTHLSHVGLLLSNSKIIHASGQVRIDPFDKKGIHRRDTGRYTHELIMIRRII